MKIKLVIAVIISALLLSGWAPVPIDWGAKQEETSQAAVATLTLVINNKTGETFTLTMKGPSTYTWTIKPGKNTQTIVPGKYKYNYKACGGTAKNGTVEVKKNNQTLVLAVCKQKAGDKAVSVTIQNNTGGYMTLSLTGPATYRFQVKPGKSTINVIKGKYTYTAWGCGGSSASGTKNLKGGTIWTWWCG
ncbi:MAG: hypothetical protein MUE67_03565 [Anaerolineales bacterium]|jgi:hypothetical protein|nr:hypothetical protein [Anaerolineales bacterium]